MNVKSGLGLFAEALGPIVACSDFEVETVNIAAIVFILDAHIWDGDFAIHHFEIELIRYEDSFVSSVFVGPHPGKGLVEVLLKFEVEDDSTNLAARALDFSSDFLIEPVEIGVVSGLLRLHQAIVGSLPTGDELRTFNEPMAILCQS